MPVINYQGTKMSARQKQELIKRFTEIAADISQTPARYFTVVIQEFDDDSLGTGGKTVAEIKTQINK